MQQKFLIALTTLLLVFGMVWVVNAQEGSAYLGLRVQDGENGITVVGVAPDSGAAKADIQEGDVITAYNGNPVKTSQELTRRVGASAVGDTIKLEVMRGEETLTVEVTLTARPANTEPEISVVPIDPNNPTGIPGGRGGDGRGGHGGNNAFGFGYGFPQGMQLGVSYRALTLEIASAENLSAEEGALVTEVFPGTPAEDSGLQVGDIITAVDGDKVDIEHTLSDRLFAYEAQDRVMLTVLRGEETLEIGTVLASEHPAHGWMSGFGNMFIPNMIEMGGANVPNITVPNANNPGINIPGSMTGTVEMTTEPPTEIPAGMFAYVCKMGGTVMYMISSSEMPSMMGECEPYKPE